MTAAEFRTIRKALGLTQTEWGLWLGVGQQHVSDIERGKAESSVTLARLADAFRCGYRVPPDAQA